MVRHNCQTQLQIINIYINWRLLIRCPKIQKKPTTPSHPLLNPKGKIKPPTTSKGILKILLMIMINLMNTKSKNPK